jgi:hypothetical protein
MSSQNYLIDTEYRATEVRRQHPRATVRSLPVGAPRWARRGDEADSEAPVGILFYGNYLPLHGADRIVEGLTRVARTDSRSFTATMVGFRRRPGRRNPSGPGARLRGRHHVPRFHA